MTRYNWNITVCKKSVKARVPYVRGRATASPTEVGSGIARPQSLALSQLIDVVNERFGTDLNQADQLFFDQIVEAAMADDGLR